MSLIDENMAEQSTLEWFEELVYERVVAPDIAPAGPAHERENYKLCITEIARVCPGKHCILRSLAQIERGLA